MCMRVCVPVCVQGVGGVEHLERPDVVDGRRLDGFLHTNAKLVQEAKWLTGAGEL